MSRQILFTSFLLLLLVGCQNGSDVIDANAPLETRRLVDNLIVRQDDAAAILQDGEAIPIDEEALQTAQQSDRASYAVNFNEIYTLRDGDVVVTTRGENDTHPLIETPEQDERRIWGVVGGWLLVESFAAGQEAGSLIALDLEGEETLVVTDDPLSGTPILSPFDHIIYSTAQGAFSWHPDETRELMPFDQFQAGSFSSNGVYLAIDTGEKIDIFNMARLQHIASVTPSAVTGDTPPPPMAWHPNGEWLAYTVVQGVEQAIHVANLETLDVKVVPNANNPQFSPDGEWLAVYDLARSRLKLVNLETNATMPFAVDGFPLLWPQ